jgi:hypothetical protein
VEGEKESGRIGKGGREKAKERERERYDLD